MAKRFSDLEKRVLEMLRSGSDPKTQLQADDPVRKYWEWRTTLVGDNHEIPEASTRNTQGITRGVIQPFGLDPIAANFTYVTMSKRTASWAKGLNADIKAKFNHVTLTSGQSANFRKYFSPAKAVLRQVQTTVSEQTSRITGRKYKTKTTSSQQGYVVPIGRTNVGGVSFADVAGLIVDNLPAGYGVSFVPEKGRFSFTDTDINT